MTMVTVAGSQAKADGDAGMSRMSGGWRMKDEAVHHHDAMMMRDEGDSDSGGGSCESESD